MSRNKLILLFILIGYQLANKTVNYLEYPTETVSTFPVGKSMTMRQTGVHLDAFLRDVSWIESNENHKIISKNGMLGKYQFYWPTAKHHLKTLELDTISKKEFLSRPGLQDTVMIMNMAHNENILKTYIQKYSNQTINGIKVTRSGILAAAQFGPGKVIEFFEGGSKFGMVDGNGVHVGTYMQLFAGYKLPKKLSV